MHNEFMAFINEEETARAVQGWAEKQGFPPEAVRLGGPDLFAAMLDSDPPPKLALIDFDGQESPGQIAARLVGLCGPVSHLVAIGKTNDVALYRTLIAAGFDDYLVKPLTPELLTQTLLNAARGEHGGATAHKEAKTIVVIGVRGGVGASTIAANVAWIIAHVLKKKSVLLDLDLQFGSSALSLDIEPGHGLRDVVSSPQRVDGLMIAGALVSESESFGVLSAEESIDEVIHVDAAAIVALAKELKGQNDALVIDMPRHMIPTQKRVLATAHEIVLVTEMSLLGIRDALRIRTVLKGLGTTARLSQVATRIGPARAAAVDEAAFAKGAQAKIDFILPDDHKTMVAASNAGKMLAAIAPSAPLTKAMHALASFLLNAPEQNGETKKGQTGLIASLLKRKEAKKT